MANKKRYRDSDEVVVVFAADENVVLGLYVSIYSVLCNICNERDYYVIIVDGGIGSKSTKRIQELFQSYDNARVSFKEAPTHRLSHLEDPRYISRSSYLALLIPEVINTQIEKFIYLDSDVLVEDDIRKLYDNEMEDNTVLAVQEYVSTTMSYASRTTGLPSTINCNPEDPYFNSGVLLVNAQRWRDDEITKRAINFRSRYMDTLTGGDQDPLNGVLYDKWGLLNPRWNIQLNWKMEQHKRKPNEREPKYKYLKNISCEGDILKQQGILHFNNQPKPWHLSYIGPCWRKYNEAIKRSEWHTGVDQLWWLLNRRMCYVYQCLMRNIYHSRAYKMLKDVYVWLRLKCKI